MGVKRTLAFFGITLLIPPGALFYLSQNPEVGLKMYVSTLGVEEANPESMEAVGDTLELFEPYFTEDMSFDIKYLDEVSYKELLEIAKMPEITSRVANELDNNPESYPEELVEFYNYIKERNAAEEAGQEFDGTYTFYFGEYELPIENEEQLEALASIVVETLVEFEDDAETDANNVIDTAIKCAQTENPVTCVQGMEFKLTTQPAEVTEFFMNRVEEEFANLVINEEEEEVLP